MFLAKKKKKKKKNIVTSFDTNRMHVIIGNVYIHIKNRELSKDFFSKGMEKLYFVYTSRFII